MNFPPYDGKCNFALAVLFINFTPMKIIFALFPMKIYRRRGCIGALGQWDSSTALRMTAGTGNAWTRGFFDCAQNDRREWGTIPSVRSVERTAPLTKGRLNWKSGGVVARMWIKIF